MDKIRKNLYLIVPIASTIQLIIIGLNLDFSSVRASQTSEIAVFFCITAFITVVYGIHKGLMVYKERKAEAFKIITINLLPPIVFMLIFIIFE